jgi:hypothetical protein
MFGHDDNHEEDKDVQINDELLQPEEQQEHQDGGDNQQSDGGAVEVTPSAPAVDDNGSDNQDSSDNHDNNSSSDSAVTLPESDDQQVEPTASEAAPASSALLDIKQQALQSLSPLLGHLDQTPEEKFRTTMMLIQASDNQDLVKVAFEAAQSIEDEKTRAQALLDIVNEINYFTQKEAA